MSYDLPGVKPHVLAAANEAGSRFGITSIGGVGDRPNKSEHPEGLALDFMVTGPRGDQLADYMRANARRLAVTYVIWKQRIWSLGRAEEGWRPQADRGGVTANHFDHVHVSFSPVASTNPTQPTIPGIGTGTGAGYVSDPARVAALLVGLPWPGDKLRDRLDEAGAAVVRTVTTFVIAGVLVAGGVALVVAGLTRAARSKPAERTSDDD